MLCARDDEQMAERHQLLRGALEPEAHVELAQQRARMWRDVPRRASGPRPADRPGRARGDCGPRAAACRAPPRGRATGSSSRWPCPGRPPRPERRAPRCRRAGAAPTPDDRAPCARARDRGRAGATVRARSTWPATSKPSPRFAVQSERYAFTPRSSVRSTPSPSRRSPSSARPSSMHVRPSSDDGIGRHTSRFFSRQASRLFCKQRERAVAEALPDVRGCERADRCGIG